MLRAVRPRQSKIIAQKDIAQRIKTCLRQLHFGNTLANAQAIERGEVLPAKAKKARKRT